MLLHEFPYCGSRIRLQIPNGFTEEWPTHVTGGEIEPGFGLFSFDKNEEDEEEDWEKRKNGRRRVES